MNDANRNEMVGRRVRHWTGATGEVTKWEPLSHAICDTLVLLDAGRVCWFASHCLTPMDGLGPLPDRHEVCEAARLKAHEDLKGARERLIEGWAKPWPGMEFAKAHVGNMLNGAINDLEHREG